VPFLALGRSCPQQTILLSDLAGCDLPLQIVKVSKLRSIAELRAFYGIRAFFSRVEKHSDDINSRLFLMNKKGLSTLLAAGGIEPWSPLSF
jgi:hypothetical protein